MPTSTGEPTDPNWVNGPASVGERAFVLPEPGQNLTYTPGDMKNMAALGYNYDDVSRPSAAPQMVARLQRFGMTAAAATPSSGALPWPDPNPLNFWARAEACA
jgi:tyrosinase